jgi:hypothetical protein
VFHDEEGLSKDGLHMGVGLKDPLIPAIDLGNSAASRNGVARAADLG